MISERPLPEPWWVYIIQGSGNGRLYTGIAKNVDKRLKAHNTGRGAKFTRIGGPWFCIYRKEYPSHGDAIREEIRIKKLTRAQKFQLAQRPQSPLR